MNFSAGSLVRARGREWIVLPDTDDEVVLVRPLGGTDAEVTGILTSLEDVEPATFGLPDPTRLGDYRSAQLLRDALRLGFRSGAGPFRSLARIAVEPRPYQLVPLLMALRLDPVRLLVADDVGVGKTIEAGLIAAELLATGDAHRLAVLCPPHLARQWQAELTSKFHLDATLVLPSTAARLERDLPAGQTIFERHPLVVVSLDYIKADRYRLDFVRTCPDLVIVDEAHTCANPGEGRSARQQRHELVRQLARHPERHLVLVTATPHSGKTGAFRSLLSLLDEEFGSLPDELGGEGNRRHRERLARHLVQRRRDDIRNYLGDTKLPNRLSLERTYRLSEEYRTLFDQVLRFAREAVAGAGGGRRQRVRWWSALALLRALASSPAAAAATLRNRARHAEADDIAEVDEVGRATVLDLDDDDAVEQLDVVPGADDEPADESSVTRRRLQAFARSADQLRGRADAKLQGAMALVASLVDEGAQPIVFCRFIDTATYVGEELRRRLAGAVEVAVVTGALPPAERERRIEELGTHARHVLVATDCLSEGLNLQDHFDAVVHYDLPWNPTRLEQREGRVDRFGQPRDEVRVVTYHGEDNGVDEIVLDVLLRKHRAIRSALGVSVPVPGSTSEVIEALAEGLLERAERGIAQRLPGMEELLTPNAEQLVLEWDRAAEREKVSRSLFSQHGIRVDEVAQEVDAARTAIGGTTDVARFVRNAITDLGGRVSGDDPVLLDLAGVPPALRDLVGLFGDTLEVVARFDLPVDEGQRYLSRTDPLVHGLAAYVLDISLDPSAGPEVAARCGCVVTDAVDQVTTLVLARFRFQLQTRRRGEEAVVDLAEEAALAAFVGPPSEPRWLPDGELLPLLDVRPTGSVHPGQARHQLEETLAQAGRWRDDLDQRAAARAAVLVEAHERVRRSDVRRGVAATGQLAAAAQTPVDVLGVYVYVPGAGSR